MDSGSGPLKLLLYTELFIYLLIVICNVFYINLNILLIK